MTARSSPETTPEPVRTRSPFEYFVDATILAPIGIGTALVEQSPQLIERVRSRLVLARLIGKMTVSYGTAEIRRRFEPARPTTADVNRETSPNVPTDVFVTASSTGVSADSLVLPDYDHLPAAHIVSKLGTLDQSERDAIEQYELQYRHRRTILGRLEQLRAG